MPFQPAFSFINSGLYRCRITFLILNFWNKVTIFDSCLQNNKRLNTQMENGMTINEKIQWSHNWFILPWCWSCFFLLNQKKNYNTWTGSFYLESYKNITTSEFFFSSNKLLSCSKERSIKYESITNNAR